MFRDRKLILWRNITPVFINNPLRLETTNQIIIGVFPQVFISQTPWGVWWGNQTGHSAEPCHSAAECITLWCPIIGFHYPDDEFSDSVKAIPFSITWLTEVGGQVVSRQVLTTETRVHSQVIRSKMFSRKGVTEVYFPPSKSILGFLRQLPFPPAFMEAAVRRQWI